MQNSSDRSKMQVTCLYINRKAYILYSSQSFLDVMQIKLEYCTNMNPYFFNDFNYRCLVPYKMNHRGELISFGKYLREPQRKGVLLEDLPPTLYSKLLKSMLKLNYHERPASDMVCKRLRNITSEDFRVQRTVEPHYFFITLAFAIMAYFYYENQLVTALLIFLTIFVFCVALWSWYISHWFSVPSQPGRGPNCGRTLFNAAWMISKWKCISFCIYKCFHTIWHSAAFLQKP